MSPFFYICIKIIYMKKLLILTIVLLTVKLSFSQKCYYISDDRTADSPYSTVLSNSDGESVEIDFYLHHFFTKSVETAKSSSLVITNENMASLMQSGQPDIPSLSVPIIIPDVSRMEVRISEMEYTDYENIEIAPFRGDFPRNINPEDVPYIYGDVYEQDEFFPSSQYKLNEPYILRDFRAQNLILTPFAYNPVTKVLRVFHKMKIKVFPVEGESKNVIENRTSVIKMNPEYEKIYADRFINYEVSKTKYNIVEEQGDLLIICYDDFMDEMQDFVAWKNQIGRKTEMVPTSQCGTNADAIKNYVASRYAENPNLTYLLLVGDFPQIQGKYMTAPGYSGYSDWWYGQLSGDDYYNELIVGRFSAEQSGHVRTQANKVIHYEKEIASDATWLTTAMGVSKRENQQGHNGEDDYQHMDNIRDDLLNYNYDFVHRDYLNVPNVTSSADLVSEHINAGVSLINYCNHGGPTKWNVFNYDNSKVNALVNDNKLPYIISVACYNGQYNYSQPCFAETWLRATNNNNGLPTGAVGGMFAWISQPWEPPMYGQDEMVDIIVESYQNNIKRTMGGVSLNGNMIILDYGSNIPAYYGTYNTWNLFGDPTLTLRNDVPQEMNVSHFSQIQTNSTSMEVYAVNPGEASATLSINNEIIGTSSFDNGKAVINFEPITEECQAILTVFGFNRVTYQSEISFKNNVPLEIIVSADPVVMAEGNSSTLTAYSNASSASCSYSWSPAESVNNPNAQNTVATPSETTVFTCTLSDGVSETSASVEITVLTPPTDFAADVYGNDVNLSWNPTINAASHNIYRNDELIASRVNAATYVDQNLESGEYSYSITTVYSGVESLKSEAQLVTVSELLVNCYANPTMIIEGDTAMLSAVVPETFSDVVYSWSPAESLSDSDSETTLAFPQQTTTYSLTVTSFSQTANSSVTVNVLQSPKNLTAELNVNNVVLQWDEVELAEYYMLYRNGELIASDIISTSYEDNDLSPDNYCYVVKSVCDELISKDSEQVCVEVENCPSPYNLTAQYHWYDNEFGALVDWDKTQTEFALTEFRIYRSNDNEDYKLIQTLANVPSMTHYQFSDMNIEEGVYYYKVTAYYANIDCESEYALAENSADDFAMVDVTSLTENSDKILQIYPNPVKDKLNIRTAGIQSVEMYNMMGCLLKKQIIASDETVIDFTDLSAGVYLIKIETQTASYIRKINLEK